MKVFWGDQDGNGEATGGELMGQIEERYHVALSWVREDEDMRGVAGVGDCHGGFISEIFKRIFSAKMVIGL